MMLSVDIGQALGAFRLEAAFTSDGGLTTLFGRSGAGKTSIVNAIAGIGRPDRGRIEINGTVLFDSARGIDVPIEHRRIGYVFQEGRLFPHLTVRQNLLYGHFFARPADRYIPFDRVVTLLGLDHLLARRPAALSGGEKQRVAIGRALLASPQLLLLDEPLAALDVYRKGEILQYIELLRDEIGIPIVYVSHSVEEVVRLADTVVLLAEGRVAAVGGVEDVMGRPDLRRMAGTFESGAVVEAKVVDQDMDDDLTTLEFSGGRLLVTGVDALIGEPVRVRIRARDVSIALTPPAGISILNVIACRIAQIGPEQGGAVDLILVAGSTLLRSRITKRSLEQLQLRPGLDVHAMIKAVSLDRR
jgi:molybdate transport system ATP-binding protein